MEVVCITVMVRRMGWCNRCTSKERRDGIIAHGVNKVSWDYTQTHTHKRGEAKQTDRMRERGFKISEFPQNNWQRKCEQK